MASVAEKIGCTTQTLCNSVRKAEREKGWRPESGSQEKARIKGFDRETKDLHQANETLSNASAYFAHAELERRQR